MRTHYDNLNVSEKAAQEVIKAAYRALAQKWHPDKNPHQRDRAEYYFKLINRAFEVLSDPIARTQYDAWLSKERHGSVDAELFSLRSGKAGSHLQEESASTYPWRRFFGRCIDSLIVPTVLAVVLPVIFKDLYRIDVEAYFGSALGWFAILIVIFMLLEAAFLHTTSTTLGKFIFGIRVKAADGSRLTFLACIKRTLLVSVFGQACFVPGLAMISYSVSYYILRRSGTTPWDREVGSVVNCGPMSAARLLLAGLAVICALAFSSLLNMAKEHGSTSMPAGQQSSGIQSLMELQQALTSALMSAEPFLRVWC